MLAVVHLAKRRRDMAQRRDLKAPEAHVNEVNDGGVVWKKYS